MCKDDNRVCVCCVLLRSVALLVTVVLMMMMDEEKVGSLANTITSTFNYPFQGPFHLSLMVSHQY